MNKKITLLLGISALVLSACGGTVPERSSVDSDDAETTGISDSMGTTEVSGDSYSEYEEAPQWPSETIAELMDVYFADWTSLRSIPAPSSDMLTDDSYLDINTYEVSYDFAENVVTEILIRAELDIDAYANILSLSGYTLIESVTIHPNTDTYVSPDGTLFVLLGYSSDEELTCIYIYPNTCYEFEWPEEDVSAFLNSIAGGEESIALPSIEGAECYYLSPYDDESFYLVAFGVDAEGEYIETLKDEGFQRIYYSVDFGTAYYAHPDGSYMLSVSYSSRYQGTVLYVLTRDEDYVTEWPEDTINEYLSLYGAADGVTLPVPEFEWEFARLWSWETRFNIDLYDYNDEDNLVTHLEDYEKQMNAAQGWTYQEGQRWTSGDCLVTLALETDSGSLSIYIESIPSR